jgi:hypothetical protein
MLHVQVARGISCHGENSCLSELRKTAAIDTDPMAIDCEKNDLLRFVTPEGFRKVIIANTPVDVHLYCGDCRVRAETMTRH